MLSKGSLSLVWSRDGGSASVIRQSAGRAKSASHLRDLTSEPDHAERQADDSASATVLPPPPRGTLFGCLPGSLDFPGDAA